MTYCVEDTGDFDLREVSRESRCEVPWFSIKAEKNSPTCPVLNTYNCYYVENSSFWKAFREY